MKHLHLCSLIARTALAWALCGLAWLPGTALAELLSLPAGDYMMTIAATDFIEAGSDRRFGDMGVNSGLYYGCDPNQETCQPTLLTANTKLVTGSDGVKRGSSVSGQMEESGAIFNIVVVPHEASKVIVPFWIKSWQLNTYTSAQNMPTTPMGDVGEYRNPDFPTGWQHGLNMWGTINRETGELIFRTTGRLAAVSKPNTLFDKSWCFTLTTGSASAEVGGKMVSVIGTPLTAEQGGGGGFAELTFVLVSGGNLDDTWGIHSGKAIFEIWRGEIMNMQSPPHAAGPKPAAVTTCPNRGNIGPGCTPFGGGGGM